MPTRKLPQRTRIALMLRLLHEHYARDIDAALVEAGFDDLRGGQAKVFPFVPAEGIPVGRLADLAGVRKQTMAETVDQLATNGYLVTRPNPRDARSRLVFLSAKGEQVRPVAASAGDLVEARWARLTSERNVEALRHQLRRILIALEDEIGTDTDAATSRRRSSASSDRQPSPQRRGESNATALDHRT